jgi:prevent-host-death family protein
MARSISVAEAKAHFSECVREAEDGAPVLVTRHGRAVVAIVPVEDLEALERLRSSGPDGGLASVAGRFDDAQDFVGELDAIVNRRNRKARSALEE